VFVWYAANGSSRKSRTEKWQTEQQGRWQDGGFLPDPIIFTAVLSGLPFSSPVISTLDMSCRKHVSKLDELQKESEHKRYRNLAPRERLRMKKQLQAKEEAQRIVWVASYKGCKDKVEGSPILETGVG